MLTVILVNSDPYYTLHLTDCKDVDMVIDRLTKLSHFHASKAWKSVEIYSNPRTNRNKPMVFSSIKEAIRRLPKLILLG